MIECPLKDYKVICKLKKKELREDKKSHWRKLSISKVKVGMEVDEEEEEDVVVAKEEEETTMNQNMRQSFIIAKNTWKRKRFMSIFKVKVGMIHLNFNARILIKLTIFLGNVLEFLIKRKKRLILLIKHKSKLCCYYSRNKIWMFIVCDTWTMVQTIICVNATINFWSLMR